MPQLASFSARSVSSSSRANALLVLGPNGAGKTVLLRALLGVVPTEGKVRWSTPGLPPGYLLQHQALSKQMNR
jgi:ABC-type Mn2+/Zn2+ transport system ATPase subunit